MSLGRVRPLCLAALFAVSIGNAGHFAGRISHWPLFPDDEISERVTRAERLRVQLDRLGLDHLAYFSEDTTSEDGIGLFFLIQYSVVPVVLRRNAGDEPYRLVNNWRSGALEADPDLTLIEDYGDGLALFER